MFAVVGVIMFFWLGYMWYVTLTHIKNKREAKRYEKEMRRLKNESDKSYQRIR